MDRQAVALEKRMGSCPSRREKDKSRCRCRYLVCLGQKQERFALSMTCLLSKVGGNSG